MLKNISQIMIYEIVFFILNVVLLADWSWRRTIFSLWMIWYPLSFCDPTLSQGSIIRKKWNIHYIVREDASTQLAMGAGGGGFVNNFFFFLRKKMISLPVPYIVVLPYFQEPWFKVNWIYNTLGIFSTVVICCLRWKIFKNANTFSVIPYQILILLRYKYPNILHYTS